MRYDPSVAHPVCCRPRNQKGIFNLQENADLLRVQYDRFVRRTLAAATLLLQAAAVLAAFELTLDRRALEEAITIGQSRIEQIRSRFHKDYRVPVGRAPIDYVEVVTPFRKVVLGAETRARAGERLFGQRDAMELLGTSSDEIVFHVELTFHPHNTFIGVPGYDVSLVGSRDAAPLPTKTLDRIPRFGARLEGSPLANTPSAGGLLPGTSQPLTGGTLVARFAGNDLDAAGVYELVVTDGKTTLARARVDLSRLR